MKRIPYQQFVIGLDKLFFGRKLSSLEEAEEQYDTIEAYLEGCGWTWDDILEELSNEDKGIQAKPNN